MHIFSLKIFLSCCQVHPLGKKTGNQQIDGDLKVDSESLTGLSNFKKG